MKITLERINFGSTYTEGKLYIDGKYFCDTIEDLDRGLKKQSLTSHEYNDALVKKTKVYTKTAIPYGRYLVGFWDSVKFGSKTPLVLGVPGFTHILFHAGNDENSSAGCIILGKKVKDGYMVPRNEKGEKICLLFRRKLLDACSGFYVRLNKDDGYEEEGAYMPFKTTIDFEVVNGKYIKTLYEEKKMIIGGVVLPLFNNGFQQRDRNLMKRTAEENKEYIVKGS